MTESDLQQLILDYDPPLHVQRHCRTVADFAVFIGKRLIEKKHTIDLDLLEQSALLHDLVRVVDFKVFDPSHFPDLVTTQQIQHWEKLREKYKGSHHADAAAQILRERGWPKHAAIVEKHKFLQIKIGFSTWEEKLLYYADKRSKHDTIVLLQERLDDGRMRNSPETKNTEEATLLDYKVHELEKEILGASGITEVDIPKS